MRRVDKCPDGVSAVVTFKLAIIAKKALDGKNAKWNDQVLEIKAAPAAPAAPAAKNGISSSLQ